MNTATRTRRTRTAALATLIIATAAVSAHADEFEYPRTRSIATSEAHRTVDGQLVDVQIRVQGQTAPLYFKPGRFDRHYFQAFKGRNYSLAVRNNTGRRVGVLIAVDGLNVVNGEISNLSNTESMYVLDPYEETTIAGWRTSMNEVRKFVFVDEERSYAERTGQANGDLGWIRVLAFREVAPIGWLDRLKYKDKDNDGWVDDESTDGPRRDLNQPRAESAAPPSAPEASRKTAGEAAPENRAQLEGSARDESGNPGTGWGERKHDPVRRTEFRAERSATDQIAMRYEYMSGLRALGIFPRSMRTWDRDDGRLGFAQPPRW
jgi:hypothetical protein